MGSFLIPEETQCLKCQVFCHLLPPGSQPDARGEKRKLKHEETTAGDSLWYQLVILRRSLRLLALDTL